MSNALVHNSFRISNAKQFKESFQELADFGIGRFVPTSSSGLTSNTTSGGWDRYNTKGERIGKCGDRKKVKANQNACPKQGRPL